jgi:hypothetical protein
MLTREGFLSNIGQFVKKYCDARRSEQARRGKIAYWSDTLDHGTKRSGFAEL